MPYRKAMTIHLSPQSEINSAEKFSTHFVTKIAKLDRILAIPRIELCTFVKAASLLSSSHEIPSNIWKKWEGSLWTASTCSQDPIPSWLIKDHVSVFLPFFTRLANQVIDRRYFPWQSKTFSHQTSSEKQRQRQRGFCELQMWPI